MTKKIRKDSQVVQDFCAHLAQNKWVSKVSPNNDYHLRYIYMYFTPAMTKALRAYTEGSSKPLTALLGEDISPTSAPPLPSPSPALACLDVRAAVTRGLQKNEINLSAEENPACKNRKKYPPITPLNTPLNTKEQGHKTGLIIFNLGPYEWQSCAICGPPARLKACAFFSFLWRAGKLCANFSSSPASRAISNN